MLIVSVANDTDAAGFNNAFSAAGAGTAGPWNVAQK
jgi:hypothetical protein